MKLERSTASSKTDPDIHVIPYLKGTKLAQPAINASKVTNLVPDAAIQDFGAKEKQVLLCYPHSKSVERIALLGLGPKEKITLESLRRSYAALLRSVKDKKIKRVRIYPPHIEGIERLAMLKAIVEALWLTSYQFNEFISEPEPISITYIEIHEMTEKELEQCERQIQVVESVNFARDLINGNADDVTPEYLAQQAKILGKKKAIKTTIYDRKDLEKMRMGLMLAVARGATRNDPRLIVLEYTGDPKSKDTTMLVGKGVTYDTGGLNLKPTGSMETMKDDMSGAAAVLGTIRAAEALGLKVNIIGVIPSVENAIDGMSYKPGDVFRSYNGTTVEITNTDAEGRLILADAISFGIKKFKPKRMIDLATLTGAVLVSLGEEAAGLFSNNEELCSSVQIASERTMEKVWRLPLFEEFKELLKSPIADIKNSANTRFGGSSTAALFIERFVGDIPWVHLDIAGVAYLSDPKNYHPTRATGFGVRLLIDLLERYAR